MALNQNQFAISTLKGTLDSSGSGASLSCEFFSATPTATVGPGEMVVIVSTPAVSVTRVSKGAAIGDKYFGVVLTNPLADSYGVGKKLEVGIVGAVVMMEASALITAGADLQYDPATGKVATKTGPGFKIGVALENAAGDGSLLRVMIHPA
jgi:hypothetical protein